MQRADAVVVWPIREAGKGDAEADVNILLRQVVPVNQHLANLVGGVSIFALVRVMVLKQEVAVAQVLDLPVSTAPASSRRPLG